MGDALRKIASSGGTLGERIKPILERGDLISISDTKAMLNETFKELDVSKGIVVEGIPRSLEQIEPLLEILRSRQLEDPWLIELKISDQTTAERVGKRLICGRCQHPATYRDTHCQRCGSELIKRTDEDDETLRNRLRIYHQETEPVIEHFKKLGRHIVINGEPPIETVNEAIVREIKSRLG